MHRMNKMAGRFLFLWVLVFGAGVSGIGIAGAQTLKELPENQLEYLAALQPWMTSSKQANVEDAYKGYETLIKSGFFDDVTWKKIHQTSNAMLNRRMSANPFFLEFTTALQACQRIDADKTRLTAWLDICQQLLDEKNGYKANDYLAFLQFSAPFFESGYLRKGEGGSVSWQVISNEYSLAMKDKGPQVTYNNINLQGFRSKDTIQINKTNGIYLVIGQTWQGNGGFVDWSRFGDTVRIKAMLDTYSLEAKATMFEAKNATLDYPVMFPGKMLKGTLEDKITGGDEVTGGSYPRFESDEKVLEIKNLGEGLYFKGGFKLQGTTVYGTGTATEKALVILGNKGSSSSFQASGKQFVIRQGERIGGVDVAASFVYGKDSLVHPSITFRYDISDRTLQLSRGKTGLSRNPIADSYHQMNLDVEELTVFVEKDSVVLGRRSANFASPTPVILESLGFYNPDVYVRLQGMNTRNPLDIINQAAESAGTNQLDAEDIASLINPRSGSTSSMQSLFNDLMAAGFIEYDAENKWVYVKEKTKLYVSANANRSDYDQLAFLSKTDTTNGTLNLKTGEMTITGLPTVEFSTQRKVAAVPSNGRVTFLKDRDMRFDGKLFAGMTTLEGTTFNFDYKPFSILMDTARYFDIYVYTGEYDKQTKKPIAYPINSRIEKASGFLIIDAPENKSGKKNIGLFPSMQTKKPSFVYYDYKETQDSAYVRDSFYFELAPFSMNNLNKFDPKELAFKGKLYSADIFPPFEEHLRIQSTDYSLGFVMDTPEKGFTNYKNRGNFAGKLKLSNAGLLAEGTLKYLDASVNSQDLVFLPKQAKGTAEKFNIAQGTRDNIEIPQVKGEKINIDWRPYSDSMYVTPASEPFSLFAAGKHQLSGTLILTPGGLKGDGQLDWDKASLHSDLIAFGSNSAKADTSTISIKVLEGTDLALKTQNVKSELDFKANKGLFTANDPLVITDLPAIRYETTMNKFEWDLNTDDITFITDKTAKGSFLSTDKGRDSLRFEGVTASYKVKGNQLKVTEVESIRAADAFIYPDSGLVFIENGGQMKVLENARIVADTTNKNHVINRATVQIEGRRKYSAQGFYEYNVGPHKQEIEFAEILGVPAGKDKLAITRAKGEIKPDDNFYIDHKTRFIGEIKLSAESPSLDFKGYAQLNADRLVEKPWFSVSSVGDKKDLFIAYTTPKDTAGVPVFTGLYLSKENSRIYPRAMMNLYFRKDRPILPVTGYFNYLEKKDQFVFGDSTRMFTHSLAGNKFVVDNSDGSVSGEGRLQLCTALKYITLDAAGQVKTKLPPPPDTTVAAAGNTMMAAEDNLEPPQPPAPVIIPVKADVMAGIKLIVPDALMKEMETDFKSSTFDAEIVGYLTDLDFYKMAARNLLPTAVEETQTYINEIQTTGFLTLPKKHNPYTFLFNKLPMHWDADYQSFVSTQSKIGLAAINGEPLNKMVEGYVEMKMPSNEDDRLYIYLKSPSEFFYFFGYKQGIINIVSNNTKFMDELFKLKAKDLVMKMEDGETYEIQPVEVSTAQAFLRRIQASVPGQ